ncbi:hypothetical protein HELRODRAFT_194261 [Helobdella robusta]|uniref:Fucolectin tachylectin-4 pentraxin-1 domain-containing protein n=1 Tax=Helobdella robusta TaxID=6412 RepID=T1FVV6_HELRO|nr:hypothetical protein HELRODRAFT_194261 [Helobdella robusta]ESN92429.1 hypothetical protein HELRODRAFT_194261 [Helobdella robusta]
MNDKNASGLAICAAFVTMAIICFEAAVAQQQTFSRSHFNNYVSHLAADSDVTSCYRSGYGAHEWLVYDLATARNISGLKISGVLHTANIRIGNFFANIGVGDGFGDNGLCYFTDNTDGYYDTMGQHTLKCPNPINGRYVSVQMVDPVIVNQLVICDIKTI